MSQENVELVRRAYAELGPYAARVDASAIARFAAPDIEFDLSAVYPDAPRVRGLDALTQSLPWGGSTKLEPERFFDVDDERVLVFVRVTAKGEGSGVPVELRDAHELTIRDGLCTRVKVYLDRNEALKAVGLPEKAMSGENIEVVLQGVRAFNRRDANAFVAIMSKEVEWEDQMFFSEPARIYRSRTEVREWFNQVVEPWERLHLEVEEITEAADDRVFAGLLFTARGRTSGVETQQRFWQVIWIADGNLRCAGTQITAVLIMVAKRTRRGGLPMPGGEIWQKPLAFRGRLRAMHWVSLLLALPRSSGDQWRALHPGTAPRSSTTRPSNKDTWRGRREATTCS
jgi:ketosteroid isomerase-like protein